MQSGKTSVLPLFLRPAAAPLCVATPLPPRGKAAMKRVVLPGSPAMDDTWICYSRKCRPVRDMCCPERTHARRRIHEPDTLCWGGTGGEKFHGALPRHGSTLPRHGSALPRHGSALPRHGSALSRHGSALPPRGSALPPRGSALPRRHITQAYS
jgi:hypothetical protein